MRSDTAQGLFWIAVGGAILYASWTMDRLANLGVPAYSAPGLLPGILGVFIAIFGAAMLARRGRQAGEPIDWRRIGLPLVLCLGFAAGMVGRGVPFWLAAWIFITVTIFALEYRARRGERRRLAVVALGVGGAASIAIALVFQELFLIRLP